MINRKGFREAGCCREGEKEKKMNHRRLKALKKTEKEKKISVKASRRTEVYYPVKSLTPDPLFHFFLFFPLTLSSHSHLPSRSFLVSLSSHSHLPSALSHSHPLPSRTLALCPLALSPSALSPSALSLQAAVQPLPQAAFIPCRKPPFNYAIGCCRSTVLERGISSSQAFHRHGKPSTLTESSLVSTAEEGFKGGDGGNGWRFASSGEAVVVVGVEEDEAFAEACRTEAGEGFVGVAGQEVEGRRACGG
ncbi:hypothetical protein VIGAN_09113400 [Vigna angularis var. angularis]|uniref:Uncharacterized protein n=1 Tax=Vigna angularis var. angularis TaxID=157739 RepID=A0A0S3SY97_PHAAN|nr:hypothetical protein VIGAN_09113400 [Vigna angularis var. angularis]